MRETPSLFKKKKEEKQVAEETKKSAIGEQRLTEYTEEQLQRAWKSYRTLRLESGASDTEKLVLDRSLEKAEGHRVLINLESQLENSILDKFEADLVRHLRQELDNTTIAIDRKVTEQVSSKNLYTSKEKFEYMAKQNPVLRELKDRLGLDFEY